MKKYTIITAVFGNYECLHENQYKADNVEYICVTDNANLKSDTWKIVLAPKFIDEDWSPRKKTYYVRYHLFEFCNTENALWIDGNMEIGNISIILAQYESFGYSCAFFAGMPISDWLREYPYKYYTPSYVSCRHAADRIEQISNILAYMDKLHIDYIEHLNGRFRMYKNTDENKEIMQETYDALMSDELLCQKHYEFERPDIFYYDEPIAGLILAKYRYASRNVNPMFIIYEQLPFTLYKHNGIEKRNKYE